MNKGIIKKIYRSSDIDNIQTKLNQLGLDKKYDAVLFFAIRTITTLILAIVLFIFYYSKYFIIPFIVILYYYLFYYIFITIPLNKRIKELDKDALAYFEVLTLCLESGKNLENSLELTCRNIDNSLSDEFKKCLFETKFGKSLMESLEDLKKRIPSETVNNIILNMTQTSVFGNSIVDTMNTQVDYLREKQMLEIKAQINKIPNKVSIISVLFIVPLILLIILGPFIIGLL